MVKRTPLTRAPPPAPPRLPPPPGTSSLRSTHPSWHAYAVPPHRGPVVRVDWLARAYRAGIRKEYTRHAFHAGQRVGRSLIRTQESAARMQVYSAGDGTLGEPSEEENQDQICSDVMATYVRTVVATMQSVGLAVEPFPVPDTRTRRHQYTRWRFYNPLTGVTEAVPTDRTTITRWIRRQKQLGMRRLVQRQEQFAAANSLLSMRRAVPIEQDDALNLAYTIDSTPMGQDDALNLAYAIATTPMVQDMDTTTRFSNRRRLVARTFREYVRRRSYAATRIQSIIRDNVVRQAAACRSKAATRMQAAVRGHTGRRINVPRIRRFSASKKIQARLRGCNTRRSFAVRELVARGGRRWHYDGSRGRYDNMHWQMYHVGCLRGLKEIAEDLLPRLGQLPVHISMKYAIGNKYNQDMDTPLQLGNTSDYRWIDGGHIMTHLSRNSLNNVRIESLVDLLGILEDFLVDRENLHEMYTDETSPLRDDHGYADNSVYMEVVGLRFRVYMPRFTARIGDRQSYLMTHVLDQNDGKPGRCIWNAIRLQLANRPNLSNITDKQFLHQTRVSSNGITLEDLDIIEEKFEYKSSKKAKPYKLSFVVFDMRYHLIRLPPYREIDKHLRKYVYLVLFNGHFYSPKSANAARDMMQRDLSFVDAMMKSRIWNEAVGSIISKRAQAPAIDGSPVAAAEPLLSTEEAGRAKSLYESQTFRRECWINRYKCWVKKTLEKYAAVLPETLIPTICEMVGPPDDRLDHDANERRDAYELFRRYQDLLPDRSAFDTGLRAELGDDLEVKMKRIGQMKVIWVPVLRQRNTSIRVNDIESLLLTKRCEVLGIDRWDKAAVRNSNQKLGEISIDFEGILCDRWEIDMRNVAVYDIETCSSADAPGRFMTYSAGCMAQGVADIKKGFDGDGDVSVIKNDSDRKMFIANSVNGLDGKVLWSMLKDLKRLAAQWATYVEKERKKEAKKPKDEWGPQLDGNYYVYAYNGSRFDNIAVIYEILANTDSVPTDPLESNGKMIRFEWESLVFLDLCLLTMSSLGSACNAYGIETQKGDFPHRLLQNCASKEAIIDILHSKTTWQALEPYIDWFSTESPDDLQKRKMGQTYKEWLEEMPLRKHWQDYKDDQFDVFQNMVDYLWGDVNALWELVEKVTDGLAKFGCNARQQCTIGSCATRILRQTIDNDIPKIADEDLAKRWGECNNGGFCGPLGPLDYTAGTKRNLSSRLRTIGNLSSRIYDFIKKVDITSLYPGSTRNVSYENSAGETIKPIDKWWQGEGFPDPTNGWYRHDFKGEVMTQEHYVRLQKMYGMVRIEFDQSEAPWPTLFQSLKYKSFQTLTPVIEGEKRFPIPQILHAFDSGIKIRLFDCDYTKETFNPFDKYMRLFEGIKNDADAIKKELDRLDVMTPEQEATYRKAGYDRTIAKLFLNALLGRINMKVDRPQHAITGCSDDVVNLMFNDEKYGGPYRNVHEDEIQCGENIRSRLKFQEGSYHDHVESFAVAPYLSAYMLAYSKILMAESFKYIVELGGMPLYTDTDSIAFACTKTQWEKYALRFVPPKKTFGGMELEGTYVRLVTIGPKKFIAVGAHYYEFKANGIPARHNTDRDLLRTFERVLHDRETQDVGYFSIKALTNFQLEHTTGATKRLRFIMLKGRLDETGCIQWWRNAGEFEEYCSGLVSVVSPPVSQLTERVQAVVDQRGAVGAEEMEIELQEAGMACAVNLKHQAVNMAEQDLMHRVYGLVAAGGETYIGYSPNPERRLRQHNGELAGGARHTANGDNWVPVVTVAGFEDKSEALKFEFQCQRFPRDGAESLQNIFKTCIVMRKWRHLRIV